MDNMFVIATIFGFLAVPRIYQHRVLFWGILGVIVFRAIFIGLGAALVHSFAWILVLFGGFLVFTGIRMFTAQGRRSGHGAQSDPDLPPEALPDQSAARRPQLHDQAAGQQDRQARDLPQRR